MEVLGLTFFAVMVPAVIFAGVSKGGFGSGAAFASSSILALVMDPGMALGIMLPLLMLIDVSSLPAYWKKWDWPTARVLLLGGVPGTILGALFYAWSNPDAIRLIIGLISVLFVAWQLARAVGLIRLGVRFGPKTGLTAGVVVGFTSFVSHAGGPAAAVYMLGQGLSKTAYQATTVLVFWAINLFKSGFYAGMGIFTWETLTLDLWLAPFAVLGTWIGIKAHRMVPERVFFGLTYALLTITGSKLIWDALT
ncbi:sulfite exporter TauE/SafE family protein [Thetidibacter halocola]